MRGILSIPAAGLSFFFAAWLCMVFIGVVSKDLGINPISYVNSMVVTIALWLVVAPLIQAISRTGRHASRNQEKQNLNLISGEELKEKIERGDDFKLVMVLSEWAFRAKHIPGSINIDHPQEATQLLSKDDEIVVYCSDPACPASKYAYMLLESGGYENIRRYEGGITGWEEAGYPIEGEWAGSGDPTAGAASATGSNGSN